MPQSPHAPSPLLSGDIQFLTDLYAQFLQNPASVDESFAHIFRELGDEAKALRSQQEGPSWTPKFQIEFINSLSDVPAQKVEKNGQKKENPATSSSLGSLDKPLDQISLGLSHKAFQLLEAYRCYGHFAVALDPLGRLLPKGHPSLTLAFHGLAEEDLGKSVHIPSVFGGQSVTLGQAIAWAQGLYCQSIGYDYAHVTDAAKRRWLQEKIESGLPTLHQADKYRLLEVLTKAEFFERFLSVKFPAAKRFGLEGGDSMIPLLESVLAHGTQCGVRAAVIGMAHRGRLNVLTNVMEKPYGAVFAEFKNGVTVHTHLDSSGDVKYHMGASTDREFAGKKLHLTLMPNPSHLEAVNPVAMGKTRACLDDLGLGAALCVLIHGDAAFAGQGLVAECLSMSELSGYKVGGTYHIIINNQIGFTTNPDRSRSTYYASDIGRGLDMPIFHVNGDDPEAVVQVGLLAAQYRQTFESDVIIDLVCYRRHGHNEGDEPAFTQPQMYAAIAQHPMPRKLYAQKLVGEKVISAEAVEAMKATFEQELQAAFEKCDQHKNKPADWLQGRWGKIVPEDDTSQPVTGVDLDQLKAYGRLLCHCPEDFSLNPKIARQIEQKRSMFESGEGIDWGTGEALAFASLLAEGHKIRLSGQDCERGTFSHRHAVWTDQKNEKRHIALHNVSPEQGDFEVVNSLLSEAAVLGYEYGYAYHGPQALVLWEAQFGDFANGAQVFMDQFISSAESKWLRKNGMVLLLPHGFEGQGPEHSSARLERYLQLCAQGNMRVVNCTTPANYFHVLRRQIHSQTRKPLIVMTPKSLLRLKAAGSLLKDFSDKTSFLPVIDDVIEDKKSVKKVILCSGKVYYDLLSARAQKKLDQTVALIRLEQFYPFPEEAFVAALRNYPFSKLVWCQEEPQNMGGWGFVAPLMASLLAGHKMPSNISYMGRPSSASPATGSDKIHATEQQGLVDSALNI